MGNFEERCGEVRSTNFHSISTVSRGKDQFRNSAEMHLSPPICEETMELQYEWKTLHYCLFYAAEVI